MITDPIGNEIFLSVKDFADRCGISTQYIYKCVNNKLQPYVKHDGNKTLINSEALSLFTSSADTDEIEVANEYMERLLTSYRLTIDCLQQENARLISQLETKDTQISAIDERLHESHILSLQLTDRQQALLQAAIDEAEQPIIEPVKVEPPTKKKWWQRKKQSN